MYTLRDIIGVKNRSTAGSVLIIVSVGIIAFCAVAAIVIDVSRMYLERARIEETVEASTFAAAREMSRYKIAGQPFSDTQEAAIKQVAISFASANGLTLNSSNVVLAGNRVFIDGNKKIDFTFARVIGFDSEEITARRAVEVDDTGKAAVVRQAQYHVMPWGVPHRELIEPYDPTSKIISMAPSGNYDQLQKFTPGKEYVLKLGNGVASGDAAVPAGTQIVIPMGMDQSGVNDQWSIGFKRAYGLVLWLLTPESRGGAGLERVQWLLGYRGGAFMFDYNPALMTRLGALKLSGSGLFGSGGVFTAEYDAMSGKYLYPWVKYWVITDAASIFTQTTAVLNLTSAPRIGVYSSGEDAVTRTLDDAGIPYDNFYDNEVLAGILTTPLTDPLRPYTWLHLHHEDFTKNVGTAGQAPVPYISIWDTDAANGLQTGSCSLLYVRGWNWTNYQSGNKYIRVYFGDQIMQPVLTSTYSGCTVGTDSSGNPVVNANDAGNFEVYFTIPQKSNGKYLVYARTGTTLSDGGDASSNYVTYNVTGSSISPTISAVNNSTLDNNVSTNSLIKVTGSSFGAYQKDIVIKFDGMGQYVSKTMTYINCNVLNSLVTADGSGNFEVLFYAPDVPDGTHEVYAQVDQAVSNKIIFNVNNYRTPVIGLNDYAGIADSGPKSGSVYVSGSGFVPNYTGITVKFNSQSMNVEDTSYYNDDFVFGGTITSNSDGRFNVRFTVADNTAEGTYEVKAFAGLSSSTESQIYTVKNITTAEISVYDLSGDIYSGPSGTELICRGVYFSPLESGITLRFGTQELTLVDTSTYSADYVFPPENKVIKSDFDGKFEVKFTVPAGLSNGVYQVRAYVNGSAFSNIANYTVMNNSPSLSFTDSSLPYNAGPAGESVRVAGTGFFPGADNIKFYFNGSSMNLRLPDDYTGSATVSNNNIIKADQNGSFEVEFTAPLITPSTYTVIAFNPTQMTPSYNYNLGGVSSFYTSSNADFSTSDDSFSRNAVMYVKVMTSDIDPLSVSSAYYTVECNYHSASPHASPALNLTNNGNFTYTGTFNWSAYSNVHNGTWQIKFHIIDAGGNKYEPTKVINITGTNVSTQSYAVSSMANLTAADYSFSYTNKLYYKVQSHIVDSTAITQKTAMIYCALNREDHAQGHYCVFGELANNLDGTYNGMSDLNTLVPKCHLGLWYLDMKIVDGYYNAYNPVKEICLFSSTSSVRLIASRNNYFVEAQDHSTTAGPSYAFNGDGKVHLIFNTTPANVNFGSVMTAEYWIDFAETTSNFKSGNYNSGPNKPLPYMVSSPKYTLANNNNGSFSGEIMLNAAGINRRSFDRYFRVNVKVVDTANVTAQLTSRKQSIDVNNTQAPNVAMDHGHGDRGGTWLLPFGAVADLASRVLVYAEKPLIKARNFIEIYRAGAAVRPFAKKDARETANEIALNAFFSKSAVAASNRFGDERMSHDVAMLSRAGGRDIYRRFNSAGFEMNIKPSMKMASNETASKLKEVCRRQKKQDDACECHEDEKGPVAKMISSAIMPASAYAAAYTGKYAVTRKIHDWVVDGGYMFTMCYATESIDRTLARDAAGNRMVDPQGAYDYQYTFGFTGFNPDALSGTGAINSNNTSNFTIINQDATLDKYKRPIAVTQNHKLSLPGFSGATDSFAAQYVKAFTGPNNSPVNILARIDANNVKYIGAEYGKGWFSFLAGHDPRLTETYRLILDNIMIGSLSVNNPKSSSYISYGILDWDMTDDQYEGDKGDYTSTIAYGHYPSLFGSISTTYPGDLPGDPLVDSIPYCFEDASNSSVSQLYSADPQTPIGSGMTKRSYLNYADGSSRYVLVPIVSTFKTNGSLACTQAANVSNTPAFIYKIVGRDKVRIKGYGLFFLSDNVAHPDADPNYNEVGSTTYGEVRGKFIGYLK